ncbi:hypothetical protein N7478_012314 [Penicillium angulare]|uniref:uncharacterized protein n=1 Tax=Penicillium angulare TaxID=116970 RepID=UPI00253FCAF9|nr:uncharacterized protein N7478_012314 [Penicillium angulare]KAJ5259333.1 hypothetical protein N7478_012314 [Penicillium angulare]
MSDPNSQQLTCFLEKWKNLRAAVVEMAPNARVITQIEDVIEENETTQAEINELHIQLQKSEKEEERLKCFIQEIIEQFEKRIVIVQEKQNSSVLATNALLAEAKEEVADSRSKSKESEQRCISLERELELQICELSAISDEHQKLISDLGFVNLEEDLQLVSSGFVNYERPIPISDSIASKHLRVATLKALIATELAASVFLAMPSYAFWLNRVSPTPDWDKMAKEKPMQEAVIRSVSSIVYAPDEQELEETRIAIISDRITSKLKPLLIEMTSFEERLQRLLRESFYIWRAVQRSKQRVVALTDGLANVDDPGFDIDEGVSIQGAARADKLGSPIVTFPTISAVASLKARHTGYILRASNPLYISGAIEAEHQVKRVRGRG